MLFAPLSKKRSGKRKGNLCQEFFLFPRDNQVKWPLQAESPSATGAQTKAFHT